MVFVEMSKELAFLQCWKHLLRLLFAIDAFKPHTLPNHQMTQKLPRPGLGLRLRVNEFYPQAIGPYRLFNEAEKLSHKWLLSREIDLG